MATHESSSSALRAGLTALMVAKVVLTAEAAEAPAADAAPALWAIAWFAKTTTGHRHHQGACCAQKITA
jgi:hypothetical protein